MQQNSKIKRSEQEKGMLMGVLTREIESQPIIHLSFLLFWRWLQVWSSFLMHLSSITNLPWYLSHQRLAYIHTSSLLVSLYGTNTVSVIKVLETSGLSFVYDPVITFTCHDSHYTVLLTVKVLKMPTLFSLPSVTYFIVPSMLTTNTNQPTDCHNWEP